MSSRRKACGHQNGKQQVPCDKTLSPTGAGFFPDVANSPRTGRSEVKNREGQLGKSGYIVQSYETVLSRMLTGEKAGMDHRTSSVEPLPLGCREGSASSF